MDGRPHFGGTEPGVSADSFTLRLAGSVPAWLTGPRADWEVTMRLRGQDSDTGISNILWAIIALVIAIILLLIYALVASLGSSSSPEPTESETATPTVSVTGGPSPAETTGVVENWSDVPPADRPPAVASPQPGEPAALQFEIWVWDLVDSGWDVEIWRNDNPAYVGGFDPVEPPHLHQAIYLVAPDGTWLKLYSLRTDVTLTISEKALDERLVWIQRLFWEEAQVVEFSLVAGTASESWSNTGFSNVAPITNQEGWFVVHDSTLSSGRQVWYGLGYAAPLNGVFFRDSGGPAVASGINPSLGAMEYYCMRVDPSAGIAIYEGYEFNAGPIATWQARLLVHDISADTWIQHDRLGPFGTPCHDDFVVTNDYYIGDANRVDQVGLHRYYFDGRPDEAV